MTQPIRWLQAEIADRMLQKLDIVKLQPRHVLLIPDFPGVHARFLAKRFPRAYFHCAPEMGLSKSEVLKLKLSRLWASRLKGTSLASVDEYQKTGRINLPDSSVDLIFSVLLMQDLLDPKNFLQECWRVLKEGGLLCFSYLGPDTGKELRSAVIDQGHLKELTSPWDMHDMGDALQGERFSDPVMDMEFLNLSSESDEVMLTDAKALNLIKPVDQETLNSVKLPQNLTLEVVYGHAWVIGKHLAKAKDHVAYIDPNQIQRKTRSDSA